MLLELSVLHIDAKTTAKSEAANHRQDLPNKQAGQPQPRYAELKSDKGFL